jgi:hypothetical protein
LLPDIAKGASDIVGNKIHASADRRPKIGTDIDS